MQEVHQENSSARLRGNHSRTSAGDCLFLEEHSRNGGGLIMSLRNFASLRLSVKLTVLDRFTSREAAKAHRKTAKEETSRETARLTTPRTANIVSLSWFHKSRSSSRSTGRPALASLRWAGCWRARLGCFTSTRAQCIARWRSPSLNRPQ